MGLEPSQCPVMVPWQGVPRQGEVRGLNAVI